MTSTILHKWGFWWIYRPGRILHALIIPTGTAFRVLREDKHEPVEFKNDADAWAFAREAE